MTHHPFLLKFPPDTGSYLSLLLQGEKEEGDLGSAGPKERWGNRLRDTLTHLESTLRLMLAHVLCGAHPIWRKKSLEI